MLRLGCPGRERQLEFFIARSAEFFRSTFLSRDHYAGGWEVPQEGDHNLLATINELGRAYGMAPDSTEREDMLLRIQEAFHPYLMKYLRMIIQGTIPGLGTRAGNESVTFLRTLAPKDKLKTRVDVSESCKMLHLAFKGETTEEIYDTLVLCFMTACRRFDPHYAEKTKQACEVISALPTTFTLEQLNARVDFDCNRILPALTRKGFLSSITGKKKVVGYKRSAAWPPAPKFFESGPVGFTYMAQMWFRYYLNEHIVSQMARIESGSNVLSIDGIHGHGSEPAARASSRNPDSITPHAEGNCVNAFGNFRFMADLNLMETSFDISEMNLEWVAGTTDKLFKDLSVEERTLLYLHYHQEQSWNTIGKSMNCTSVTAHRKFDAALEKVRTKAGL